MRPVSPVLLLPVVAMLAAAITSGLGFHKVESSGPPSSLVQHSSAAAPEALLPAAAAVRTPVRSIPNADSTAQRRAAIAGELRRQDQLFQSAFHRFEGDRLAFVRSLLPAANAGDPQAQRVMAIILDQCAAKPAMHLESVTDTGMARDRETLECEALNQASSEEIGTSTRWRAGALAAGDGQDLIRDAEDFSNGKDGNARIAEFRRALSSTDPRILREIVNHAGDEQADAADFRFAVAELAQCKLGADCSGSGVSLEVLCTLEDCRGIDSVQRLFELRMSPQAFIAADERARSIANHFLAGNDDWPEAQAFEAHLRRVALQQPS